MGSAIYRGWRPRADAAVVMMLKQAGATIIGKTTTTAFAANDPTATLNPHHHGHTPGGSSSGSAAAVAAGMIPLALGTQTGGSVIRPASFCGVAAIKPIVPAAADGRREMFLVDAGHRRAVRGRRRGSGAWAFGHDRPARTAAAAQPMQAPRIGVVTQDFAGAPEAAGGEALRIAAAAAERAGASVRALALPEIVAEAWRIHADGPAIRGASGVRLGIPRQLRCHAAAAARQARRKQGYHARRLRRGARGLRSGPGRRWRRSSRRSTCC